MRAQQLALHRHYCGTLPLMLQYIKYHTYEAGDIIFRQGDSGSEFYIILNGAVDVLIKEADSDKVHRVQP